MELLIKLYTDKPSRIAIKYLYDYQAIKTYEEIIKKYQGGNFSAKIELSTSKASLSLTSEQTGAVIVYKDLDYRIEQLKKLEGWSSTEFPMLFVHIYPKANTLLVARPFRKAQFITVSQAEIIHSMSIGYSI